MIPFWYWIVIAICLIFSIFFSAADMAYSVVDKNKLKKDKSRRGKLAYQLASDYEFSISAILFGNNIANILASSLVALIGAFYAGGSDGGAMISTVIFTVIIIIFAEYLPKNIAKKYNYTLALLFAYPLLGFKYLSFIFVYPISKLFIFIDKAFQKKSIEEDIIDEDVLSEMVDEIKEDGGLEEKEAELVQSAIDLKDTQAFEILTPRVDVFGIDIHDDIYQVIKEGEIFKHSRIPVYDESIDNIIGILPIKSLAQALFKKETINISTLLFKPLIIPRNHLIIDLLSEFKKSKIHLAVVKDEYGGTEGIITMEDILEEIVGDIFDETDVVDESYIQQNKNTFIVDGLMNIDDFFELIGYKGEFETDYSTVGGFCQEMLQRFGKEGDKFIFADHYRCEVLMADQFTVDKLKVTKIKKRNAKHLA